MIARIQIISGSAGLIFAIFAPNDRHLFKRRCHGNQLKLKNPRFLRTNLLFVALPFGNGLQYRNSDFKRLDRMNFSTLCTILVTFGSETTESMLLTIAPFVSTRQKSVYHAKYLRMS